MTRTCTCMNKQKGSGLVVVLIALAVITILAGALANMVMGNLRQAKQQEKNLKAYYYALTGIDVAVAALLQEGVGGANDTLLYKKFGTVTQPNIATVPTLVDTIDMDGGEARIEVKAILVAGERWINITSAGSLDDGTSKRSVLRFLASNPSVKVRTQN